MNRKIAAFICIAFVFLTSNSFGQFQSLDLEISTSPFFDDRTDIEYEYGYKQIIGITQIGLGYSKEVGQKIVVSPKVAYGTGFEMYHTNRFSSTPFQLPDSLFIEKRKKAQFLKLGIAASYWFKNPGQGFYAESEVQTMMLLSATSNEKKRIGMGPLEEKNIDYSDEVKSNVPSFRLGIGYNLQIKRISLFFRAGLEFRISTYFNTTDNYTWANRSMGFGCRYNINPGRVNKE